MNRQRLLIISGVVAAILAIIVISILSSAPLGRQISLHSVADIKTIIINDEQKQFTQDMKVSFSQPITIRVNLDGYEAYEQTLDPSGYKDSSFTITLSGRNLGPSPSEIAAANAKAQSDANEHLQEAAKNSNLSTLLDDKGQLAARVTQSQAFQNGDWLVYRIHLTNIVTDDAIIVLRKEPKGYVVALGPGTEFGTREDLNGKYPDEVVDYLMRSWNAYAN